MESKSEPKVSILMSVYSEPIDWIIKAIDSILNQTFDDFEFIIINDNPSSKQLKEFLAEISTRDNRILIINNRENIGLTKSLNKGIAKCNGEYIARMDADDWAYPNRIRRQVEFMDTNQDLIASSALAYSWDGKVSLNSIFRPINFEDIITYTFTSSPFIHPLLIMRRDVLIKNDINYDENYPRSQDYKLAVDLLQFGKIANLSEYLLKYRVSEQQITSKFGYEQVELCKNIRRQYINNFYSKYKFGELDKDITINTIRNCEQFEYTYLTTIKPDSKELHEFKRSMNSIRRLFYYSLKSYSMKSLYNYIISGDYFKYPYNFRRFIIILIKHFSPEFIPKLL